MTCCAGCMENCIRWRNCLSIIQKCSLFGLLVDGGILKWNEFTINDAVKFSFKKDSANESLIQDTVYLNFPSFHFEKHFSPLFPAQVQKLLPIPSLCSYSEILFLQCWAVQKRSKHILMVSSKLFTKQTLPWKLLTVFSVNSPTLPGCWFCKEK